MSQGIEMVFAVFLILSLMANGAALAVLVRDFQDRREALKAVHAEREKLEHEAAGLSRTHNEVLHNWKKLSEEVAVLTTRISAIQTNLSASTPQFGRKP